MRIGQSGLYFILGANALLVIACSGPQSALSPAGKEAERIAELFWWMTAGALVIWVAVIGIGIYAALGRSTVSRSGATKILIIGGGALFPTLILALLLAYGFSLLPQLAAPAPDGSLRIAVSGEQWWWRVSYLQPGEDTTTVELANEIRLPLGDGQYAEYLVLQRMLLKKQHRGGSPYARLMLPVAARLKPEQIRDVALYYASLTPTRGGAK